MKSKLGLLTAFAALFASSQTINSNVSRYRPESKDKNREPEKSTRRPDGTIEYNFNSDGEIITSDSFNKQSIYKCVCRDEKNAKRKFLNFIKNAKR